jgi:hypothetical protein
MASVGSNLPGVIQEKLAAFGALRRRTLLLKGLGEAVVYFALATLCAGLLVWLGGLSLPARVLLSAGVYGGTLFVLWRRGLQPVAGGRRLFDLARQLEAAAGGRLRERVMSAVELAQDQPPGTSPWMARRTIALAAREITPLDPAGLVDARPLKKAAFDALVAALVLAAGFAFKGPYLRLALNPFMNPALAGVATLEVSPGHCRVRLGDSLEVSALAAPTPAQASVQIQWQDGLREEVLMARPTGTNRFTQRINAVTQGFVYRVKAGETLSPEFRVATEGPPRLEGIRLRITPPGYTGRPAREVQAGDADVFEGSRVVVMARLGGDAAVSAELRPADAPAQAMLLETNLAWIELTPKTNLTYGLQFTGVNGLASEPPERWTLRLLADEPPVAALGGAGLETKVVGPEEVLLLNATAADDVGLKDMALIIKVNGTNAQRRTLSWRAKSADEDAAGQAGEAAVSVNLAERRLEFGDELELVAEATDLSGKTGRSEPVTLSILPPENAEAAQLLARLRVLLGDADATVEALRQTRAQYMTWVRNAGADPAQAAAQGRLLQQHVTQLRQRLDDLSTNLYVESGRTKLALAPYLVGLAGEVSAWGAGQYRILGSAVANAASATPTRRDDAAARGRDLFDHAVDEAATLRAHVALGPASLEADAMAARTELAQGRYKRSLPVVRAAVGWDANLQLGLLASFFAGKDLAGPPVLQKVDRPSFDNFEVPKLGRENWSARYQGEINIPEAGPWNFACQANDGVRLFLDGQNLLPAEAWAAQGAREHKASLTLTAGWHALNIEFFQASGRNELHFRLGKQGRELAEASSANLRTRLPSSAAPTPNLAELTPVAVGGATNRLVLSFRSAARVSSELIALTNDVPQPELTRLAERHAAIGQQVLESLARFGDWNSMDASLTEAHSDELVGAAREARRLLQELLNQRRAHWRGPPALQALRVPVAALRSAVNEMRPLAWENKNRQELTSRKQAALTAATAWAQELQQAARETSQRLFTDSRSRQKNLAERATALKASMRVDRDVSPAADVIHQKLETAPTVTELVGKTEKELDRIEAALSDVLEAADAEQAAELARLAGTGLRELKARNQPAVADAVRNIATAERRAGDLPRAETLERAAAQANPRNLGEQLRDLAQRERERPASLGHLVPPPMHEGVQALDESPTAQVETANRLAKPRLALALEAERLQRESARKPAAAYSQLGRELGQLLEAPDKLTAQTLRPLAERASALAGMNGDPARQAEVNAGWDRAQQLTKDLAGQLPADALASRLDRVADEARESADNAAKRPDLDTDLDDLAAPPAPASPEQDIAAEAAGEAKTSIAAAPKERESYQEASRTLSNAAGEVRLSQAGKQAAAAASRKPGGNQPGQGSNSQELAGQPREGDYNRPTGSAAGLNEVVAGEDQAEWARLREKLREGTRSSTVEHFSEEQQEAIRAYFQRLSSEK